MGVAFRSRREMYVSVLRMVAMNECSVLKKEDVHPNMYV